ncbi:glycosyltransferase [Candidatus Uhrbacteria bacterium]|nr:glycosyltransferase [Candidatus Uhrbacteria bacterium]
MKISVIMSVYNGERFLRDAVLSVLAQNEQDLELLLVDDASSDSTSLIIKELAQEDSRIRILTNSTNLGLTKSLNIALAHAQGKYIARLDADDIALPNRFTKQLEFLNTHSDIDVLGTAYIWIDESGSVIDHPSTITDSDELHRTLPRFNPFLHSSIMMRKRVLDHVGGYDETYKKAQDYDLWLRLSSSHRFANLPEVLTQKRLTKDMISYASERSQLRHAVRARRAALKRGDYPMWYFIYIFKPLIASILPLSVVRWVRIHLFKQHQYEHPTLG